MRVSLNNDGRIFISALHTHTHTYAHIIHTKNGLEVVKYIFPYALFW